MGNAQSLALICGLEFRLVLLCREGMTVFD